MNIKRILFLLVALFLSINLSNGTNLEYNPGCSSWAADAVEIHESHFGCLDADTAGELYAFLYTTCRDGFDALMN